MSDEERAFRRSGKSIKVVTQYLKPKVRDEIRKLWELSYTMDLGYGNLETYLAVIRQRMTDFKQDLARKNETLANIKELTKDK